MNIKGIRTQNVINAYSNSQVRNTSKRNINESNDVIEISSLAKSLNNYSYDDCNVDNIKRIMDIKSKVENGTYNIDAKLTAKSLMNYIKENKF